jgi:hypothetical protein
MTDRAVAILAVAMLAGACGGGPRLDTRTFELKYLHGAEAARMVGPYVYADRPSAKGMITYTDGTLTVRETPDNLDRIARVLARYDHPLPLVRLTFHLIQADGAATTDPEIADIESTLRRLFRFRGYRLVQTGVLSANEGGEVMQQLGNGDYQIATQVRRVSGTGDSAIVDLHVHLAGRGVRFSTDVGVPAGKTAVLGNVGEDPRGTLSLTVQPQLITPSP